jgi:hypothetical protein
LGHHFPLLFSGQQTHPILPGHSPLTPLPSLPLMRVCQRLPWALAQTELPLPPTRAQHPATTAAGAATSAAHVARTIWCLGQGVAHIVQYLPPLFKEEHAPHSQSKAEEEDAMMEGLCVLVVCVLHTSVVLLVLCASLALSFVVRGSQAYYQCAPKIGKQQTAAYWGLPERSFQDKPTYCI